MPGPGGVVLAHRWGAGRGTRAGETPAATGPVAGAPGCARRTRRSDATGQADRLGGTGHRARSLPHDRGSDRRAGSGPTLLGKRTGGGGPDIARARSLRVAVRIGGQAQVRRYWASGQAGGTGHRARSLPHGRGSDRRAEGPQRRLSVRRRSLRGPHACSVGPPCPTFFEPNGILGGHPPRRAGSGPAPHFCGGLPWRCGPSGHWARGGWSAAPDRVRDTSGGEHGPRTGRKKISEQRTAPRAALFRPGGAPSSGPRYPRLAPWAGFSRPVPGLKKHAAESVMPPRCAQRRPVARRRADWVEFHP